MKRWDGLDFTTLILLLVTEARSYLNILGWESLKKQLVPRVFGLWNKKTFVEQDNWVQEDWGLVSGEHLTYFGDEAISGVLIILFPNINWLLLNLICLSPLFKIVTRQAVSSLSTMKCLYEILKAKMFFGDIYIYNLIRLNLWESRIMLFRSGLLTGAISPRFFHWLRFLFDVFLCSLALLTIFLSI